MTLDGAIEKINDAIEQINDAIYNAFGWLMETEEQEKANERKED